MRARRSKFVQPCQIAGSTLISGCGIPTIGMWRRVGSIIASSKRRPSKVRSAIQPANSDASSKPRKPPATMTSGARTWLLDPCSAIVSTNFLSDDAEVHAPDNICCNPPFRRSREFVIRARAIAKRKVAMILPLSWISGDRRSRWLQTFPRRVLIITPRPSMPPGPVILAGLKARGGRTNFAWYIWERNYIGEPTFGWLRRKRRPKPEARSGSLSLLLQR